MRVRATTQFAIVFMACCCSQLAVAQPDLTSRDAKESVDAHATRCDDAVAQDLEKQRALLDMIHASQEDGATKALEVLEKIKLPEDPTREQCVVYLDSVALVAERIGLWRDAQSEPIKRKLVGVFPPEHVDLLLTEVAKGTRLRASARAAIRAMKLEDHVVRQRIVAHLEESPDLIGIVLRNG